MTIRIVFKRLLFFVLVVWAASTIVFFIPRLSPRNAIRERFGELARTGGFSPGDIEKLIASMSNSLGWISRSSSNTGNISAISCGSISAIR